MMIPCKWFGRITLYAMCVVTVVAVASKENYYIFIMNSCLLVSATAPPQTLHIRQFYQSNLLNYFHVELTWCGVCTLCVELRYMCVHVCVCVLVQPCAYMCINQSVCHGATAMYLYVCVCTHMYVRIKFTVPLY